MFVGVTPPMRSAIAVMAIGSALSRNFICESSRHTRSSAPDTDIATAVSPHANLASFLCAHPSISTSSPQWTQTTECDFEIRLMAARPTPSRPQNDITDFPQWGQRESLQTLQAHNAIMSPNGTAAKPIGVRQSQHNSRTTSKRANASIANALTCCARIHSRHAFVSFIFRPI